MTSNISSCEIVETVPARELQSSSSYLERPDFSEKIGGVVPDTIRHYGRVSTGSRVF